MSVVCLRVHRPQNGRGTQSRGDRRDQIMSTDFATERDAFNAFVDKRLSRSLGLTTLEVALAEFRAYQRDLHRLRQKLQPSIEQADRGEGRPLDLDAVIDRVRQRVKNSRSQHST